MRGIDSRAWSANLTALNYWQCGQKMPNTLILNYIVGLPKGLLSPDLTRWEKKGKNDEALLHFACGLVVWNKVILR